MKELTFNFLPLSERDLTLLAEWLSRSHLQRWWREQEISPEYIRNKYLPRILKKDDAKPFLAYLNNKPVGYIQYYSVSDGDPNWWPDEPGPGVLGIDQFLADEKLLGKGLGTMMVSQFAKRLFEDPNIQEIRVDPRPDNLRAIRCYEKVGFKNAGETSTPDGPAVMMTLEKPVMNNR